MSSLIHIAEVAALLTVAYGLGWGVGYIVRRLTARPAAQPAIPAERLAAATGVDPDALVKAPIIVPVASDPPPAPPQPEPAPVADPVPTIAAEPELTVTEVEFTPAVEPVVPLQPAAAPEPAMSPLSAVVIATVIDPPPMFAPPAEPVVPQVALVTEPMPIEPVPAAMVEPEIIAAAEPVEPAPEPQPEIPFTATPAARPGEAWSGEIRGRLAATFEHTPDAPLPAPEPEPAIVETIIEPLPVESVSTPPVELAPPAAPPPPLREYDEDEAMRAIEGGWSRVKARAMPNAPELHDLGAAVAAAQTAVEQVLASAGIDPAAGHGTGKPRGLVRARASSKDDLKRINGLGGLDESTLNNLGFFHFDQIAAWDEAEVLWMESHVFARGRITREDWQGQARDLAATVSP